MIRQRCRSSLRSCYIIFQHTTGIEIAILKIPLRTYRTSPVQDPLLEVWHIPRDALEKVLVAFEFGTLFMRNIWFMAPA
jgi:hypothetical protein